MSYREEKARAVNALRAFVDAASVNCAPGWLALPLAGIAAVLLCPVALLFAVVWCFWRWGLLVLVAVATPFAALRVWFDTCVIGIWFLDAITTKWTEKNETTD